MHLADAFTELYYFTIVNKEYDFGQFSFEKLRDRYRDLVSAAEARARAAGVTETPWHQALFAVSAWVDECVMLSQWQERAQWQRESLQRVYFHTANGGVEFYRRLQDLDVGANDVREVYDLCLSLGFRGELYRDSDEPLRRDVAERTVRTLVQGRSLAIPEVLFPRAYRGLEIAGFAGEGIGTWVMRAAAILLPPLLFVIIYLAFQAHLGAVAKAWIASMAGS